MGWLAMVLAAWGFGLFVNSGLMAMARAIGRLADAFHRLAETAARVANRP